MHVIVLPNFLKFESWLLLCAGNIREKFPLEMADIQGAVVAADINDDGKIELVTTDTHGNVAAWTAQGQEIWEKNLKSLIPQVNHLPFLVSYYLHERLSMSSCWCHIHA